MIPVVFVVTPWDLVALAVIVAFPLVIFATPLVLGGVFLHERWQHWQARRLARSPVPPTPGPPDLAAIKPPSSPTASVRRRV